MKLNFSNLSIPTSASSFQSPRMLTEISPEQLKDWWKNIPTETKEQICSLDTIEILSDLANAANNALLVCKLHPSGKTKDLVSWKKLKGEDEGTASQIFSLNLIGKDFLDQNLAQLFSCFFIVIVREQKSRRQSPSENSKSKSHLKSHIGIKREQIDNLLEYLERLISNFAEPPKSVYQDIDSFEFYSLAINQSSHHLLSFVNVPTYLKKLLERFTAYAYILEQRIYSAFTLAKPQPNPEVPAETQRFNEILFLLKDSKEAGDTDLASPSTFKTVSQLEKEKEKDLQVKPETLQGSMNDSTQDISLLNTSQPWNDEEQNQAAVHSSPQNEEDNNAEGRGNSQESMFLLPADSLKETLAAEKKKEPIEGLFEMYEDFYVGDLEPCFDPTDFLLTENSPFECASPPSQSTMMNKENMEIGHMENMGIFHDETMYYHPMTDDFHLANQGMLNYIPAYSQQMMYPMSAYYEFPSQTASAFLPYIYNTPSSFPSGDHHYPDYNGLAKINEHYLSLPDEKECMLLAQGSQPFYPSSYEKHEEAYRGAGYEAKPKLPPRFQKRKGYHFRS